MKSDATPAFAAERHIREAAARDRAVIEPVASGNEVAAPAAQPEATEAPLLLIREDMATAAVAEDEPAPEPISAESAPKAVAIAPAEAPDAQQKEVAPPAAAVTSVIVQEAPPASVVRRLEEAADELPRPQPDAAPEPAVPVAVEAVIRDGEEESAAVPAEPMVIAASEAPEVTPLSEPAPEIVSAAPDSMPAPPEDDSPEPAVEFAAEPFHADTEATEPLSEVSVEEPERPSEQMWTTMAAAEALGETPGTSEEAGETFALLAAAAAESEETSAPLWDEHETLTVNEPVFMVEVSIPAPAEAATPSGEQPPNLETIIAEADELPLEKTLIRLEDALMVAEMAAEEPSEAEADDTSIVMAEVQQAVHEVAALLYEDGKAPEDRERISVRVTPELTDKLLHALRALGYSNPRAVLLDMVERQGIASVIQAFIRLQQLCNDESRHELRHKPRAPLTGFVAPVASWLGGAIMGHIPGSRAWSLQPFVGAER